MYRKALPKQRSDKKNVKPQYIDIEKKIELEKQKKLGEKIVEMGKTVADEIQRGNSAVIYTICI